MRSYNTEKRQILFAFLEAHAHCALSAAEIARGVADLGVSQSAVYRNLAALEAEGLVTRTVREGAREACFRYAAATPCRDRVHLSCIRCGGAFHMEDREAERRLASALRTEGFSLDTHRTVLYGVCKTCGGLS